MAARNKTDSNRKPTTASLLDSLDIREQATAMLIRINGDSTRLPPAADQDPIKALIRTDCEAEMAKITEPVIQTLEGVPAFLGRNYIAVEEPARIVADARKDLRKVKRESSQLGDKLRDLRTSKQNEMSALVATYRPSRPFAATNKRNLLRHTLSIGSAETAANALVLFTSGFKGGLLGAAAASALPAVVNIGGGALLGSVLLRLIRRENANLITRCFAWKAIGVTASVVAAVNVGFSYLRVTGNIEGLIKYIVAGKIDYSVPAICAIGLALFGITAYKWWFASHPNIQIEKLGQQIIALDRQIEAHDAALEIDAEGIVAAAQEALDKLEHSEGDDLNYANESYIKLVGLVSRLLLDIEQAQNRHADVMRDYNRMVFDALGHAVPDHYKQGSNIAVGEPRIPDIHALKRLLDTLESDYRRLRARVSHARVVLGKEPDRTLGRDVDADDLGDLLTDGPGPVPVPAAGAASPGSGSERYRAARPPAVNDMRQIEHRGFNGPQAAE